MLRPIWRGVGIWRQRTKELSSSCSLPRHRKDQTRRLHLTLKKEATRPPDFNSLQQQDRFDAFVREFNAERPHEALGMKRPADIYTAQHVATMVCPN